MSGNPDGPYEWAVDESWEGRGIVPYVDESAARLAYRGQYDLPTRRLLNRTVTVTAWTEVAP